jgi:hypothetical protein
MDGLKKEWRETQIPPEIRIRARNRAWEKIHRPVYRKRAGALAFAACAVALAALFVRFPNVPEPRVPPVVSGQWSVVDDQRENRRSYEAGSDKYEPVREQAQAEHPQWSAVILPADSFKYADGTPVFHDDFEIDIENEITALFETAYSETTLLEANYEPSRVVFNFILPKSNARLIWVANSNNEPYEYPG